MKTLILEGEMGLEYHKRASEYGRNKNEIVKIAIGIHLV